MAHARNAPFDDTQDSHVNLDSLYSDSCAICHMYPWSILVIMGNEDKNQWYELC